MTLAEDAQAERLLRAISIEERRNLLRFIAQGRTHQDLKREFAGVAPPQLYQVLEKLEQVGWLQQKQEQYVIDLEAIHTLQGLLTELFGERTVISSTPSEAQLRHELLILRRKKYRQVLRALCRSITEPNDIMAYARIQRGALSIALQHMRLAEMLGQEDNSNTLQLQLYLGVLVH